MHLSRFSRYCFLISFFVGMHTGSAREADARPFKIFDCTVYTQKPDLTRYSIDAIRIIYIEELYGTTSARWYKEHRPDEFPVDWPRQDWLKHLARKYANEPYIIIDYERLKAYGVPKVDFEHNIRKFIWMLSSFREGLQGSGSKLGFYGVPPIADLGRVIKGGIDPSLRQDNDLLRPLVDHVDVLFPSLYTWTPDFDLWLNKAAGTIAEARRIAQGKPVYAFVWPRYHEMNKELGGKFIPREYWARILAFSYKYTDGLVLWDSSRDKWDDNWEWWSELKQFIKAKRLNVY